jgi:GntR family transcriptional regulator
VASQPKYRQIAGAIRARIISGTLPPGGRLPSEDALAADWGVTRATIRNALAELEREGLVVPGKPRRVALREPLVIHVARTADRTWEGESATAGADSWLADMHAAGRSPALLIEVTGGPAEGGIARRLEIALGAPVVIRRNVRLTGSKPDSLVTFWFPATVAVGTVLAGKDSITEGSLAWLERVHGPLEHSVRVTARMPTPGEAGELGIAPGWPVLVLWRVSRDRNGPVVVTMAVYPSDRTELELEL